MEFKAAVLGAVAFHAIHTVFFMQNGNFAQAAWGWTPELLNMTDELFAHMTCSEGNIGCNPSLYNCSDLNWTCTVVPKAGKKCSETSTKLLCSKNGGTPGMPVTDAGTAAGEPNMQCISIGKEGQPKDSVLLFHPPPNCTVVSTTEVEASNTIMASAKATFALTAAAFFGLYRTMW